MVETSQTAEVSSQANTLKEPRLPACRQVYEVGFHIVPTVGDEGVAGVLDSLKSALGDAEIISEQVPQKMKLAYTIVRSETGKREKSDEAYFGVIKFALEREAVNAFQDALRADRKILRFLLIETVREEIATAPRRAVFASDRLEGEVISKPSATEEKTGEVSEADLDKSIDALVAE